MRLLVAGLFVFVGLSVIVGIVSPFMSAQPSTAMTVIVGLGMGGSLVLLCIVAAILFNRPWLRGGRDPAEEIRELEEKGLLAATDFRATRAFQAEEFEDEGSHYFLELEDGVMTSLSRVRGLHGRGAFQGSNLRRTQTAADAGKESPLRIAGSAALARGGGACKIEVSAARGRTSPPMEYSSAFAGRER